VADGRYAALAQSSAFGRGLEDVLLTVSCAGVRMRLRSVRFGCAFGMGAPPRLRLAPSPFQIWPPGPRFER